MVYGKSLLRSATRRPAPLGEAAVADLAPLGLPTRQVSPVANGACCSEHEVLAELAASASIFCASRSVPRGGDHQRLRLAAGEQRRAVHARQRRPADLDRAHGRVAAVDARLAGRICRARCATRCRTAGLRPDLVEPQAPSGQRGRSRFGVALRQAWVRACLLGSGGRHAADSASIDLGDEGAPRPGRRLPFPPACRRRAPIMDGVDRDVARSWPNTAASITSSDSWSASDSTISTAASVPATTSVHLRRRAAASCPGSTRTGRRCSRRAQRRSGR